MSQLQLGHKPEAPDPTPNLRPPKAPRSRAIHGSGWLQPPSGFSIRKLTVMDN